MDMRGNLKKTPHPVRIFSPADRTSNNVYLHLQFYVRAELAVDTILGKDKMQVLESVVGNAFLSIL
jgi:hypothetical protein